MRKAYLLLVHKNPEQFNLLIKQLLSDKEADIFIHVNKKSEEIIPAIYVDKRIVILENNIEVYWGNETINDALILLLRRALDSKIDYRYFSYRTGADIQVKSGISEFLEENNGKIFINPRHIKQTDIFYGHLSVRWPEKTRRLYENKWKPWRIYRKLLLVMNKYNNILFKVDSALPDGMELYWSRFWGFLPSDVARYIVQFIDQNQWIVKLFRKTLVPDEMFIPTIIMNSSFAHRIANDDLCKLVGHKNNHPTVITSEDIMTIKKSGSFFARKVDSSVDANVINYYYKKILDI